MKKLTFLFVMALVCCTGSHAVTIPVSGGTGLQTAIAGAGAGDVVEIQDSLTYTEDLGFLTSGVTLRAAAGQTPKVVAANSGAFFHPLTAAIGALAANLGTYIGANDITIEGISFDQPDPTPFFLGQMATTMLIEGRNVTIRNCTITKTGVMPPLGASGDHVSLAIATHLAGGKPGGPGGAVGDILIEDCLFKDGAIACSATDLQPALGSEGIGPIALALPPENVTYRNCEFTNMDGSAIEIDKAEPLLIEGCTFHDTFDSGISLGGGEFTTVTGCVFKDTEGGAAFDMNADPDLSGNVIAGRPIQATLENSYFCNVIGQHAIEARDGTLSVSNCIMYKCGSSPSVYWRPDDVDDDAALPNGGPFALFTLTVDHCDIYEPDLAVGVGTNGNAIDVSLTDHGMTVTNTIITAQTTAVSNAITGAGAGTFLTVTNNDLFAPTGVENAGGATLTESNNLNEDPLYLATFQCPADDPALFQYTNQNLAGAGTGGTDLGSQGATQPAAGISDWNLYE